MDIRKLLVYIAVVIVTAIVVTLLCSKRGLPDVDFDKFEKKSTIEEVIEDDTVITQQPLLPGLCDNNAKRYQGKGKSENICRCFLEKKYGVPFPSTRGLSWLVNPKTGHKLEIDCYNECLKLGVEYNGIQHYKYPNPFHKTYEEFKAQQARDEVKVKLCKENGITLISVPYDVKSKDIEAYIEERLPVYFTDVCKYDFDML